MFTPVPSMKSPMRLSAIAVLTGTAASLLFSAPAQAVGVNFGGVLYDVTVVETSYTSSGVFFSTASPWPNALVGKPIRCGFLCRSSL